MFHSVKENDCNTPALKKIDREMNMSLDAIARTETAALLLVDVSTISVYVPGPTSSTCENGFAELCEPMYK